jgi:hypothetical protein
VKDLNVPAWITKEQLETVFLTGPIGEVQFLIGLLNSHFVVAVVVFQSVEACDQLLQLLNTPGKYLFVS